MGPPNHFVIVDDDIIDIFVTKKTINKAYPRAAITTFSDPDKAIDFLKSSHHEQMIILLDISMFKMSGWEFIEEFRKLDEEIRQCYSVYILTNSEDEHDKKRAGLNNYINGYFVKPVTRENLEGIISKG